MYPEIYLVVSCHSIFLKSFHWLPHLLPYVSFSHMVSHATFYLIGPQAMFFEAKCCSIDGLTQQAALTACLNELFYPDGEPKALTNSTLTLIEETKAKVDEADALFLSGLRSFTHRFQHLSEAVKKGCQHPCLYYFLGECYREGDKGVAKNATRAFDSYDMAIKGK